jgi:Uncharacterised nucleotidyltransferase
MSRLLAPSSVSFTRLKRGEEFDFVCAVAGASLTAADRVEHATNWNSSGLDWAEVLRIAEHHGVLPLVARNLIEVHCGLASDVESSLRSAYEANLQRNLWFAAELTRIMKRLESQQVKVVPFKGPVLAHSVYRDLGLRSFSDLDFLVSSADFEMTKQALGEIGYHPASHFTKAVERFWLRKGNERSFDGPAGKNLLELQWALMPYFYAVDLRVEDLMLRSGTTDFGGREVPCMSPEDLLLVLCLHAAKHLWTRLIWLSDIAETLRTQTIDYALAFSQGRELGIVRILGVSFWLVKNVLLAEIPKPAEEMMLADSRVPVLGREFARRLSRGATYDFESAEYFRLIMKLRERRYDRWRYLWRLVWTPGVGDLNAVRLPESLFPLYPIVRMGRLLRRLV